LIADILALKDGFCLSFASAGRVSRQGGADEIETVNISSSKAEDGYRVNLVRAYEIEPLKFNSCTAAGASVSQDSRPVQKSWNPFSFFDGSPPVRATRNGRIGRWKARAVRLTSRLYTEFVFIQDEEPDMRKSSSKKRQASGVISEV
jgi:hypothetical protein